MRTLVLSAGISVAVLSLVAAVALAGSLSENPYGSGVYQGTALVPGVGEDCDDVAVQITYDSNNQSVGFNHAGGASNQSVTGTTQVHVGSSSTPAAAYPAGTTGVATHSTGASGTALPMVIAQGLTGGSANASSTATVTYSFTKDDCEYTVTLTVNFNNSGAVTGVTSTP